MKKTKYIIFILSAALFVAPLGHALTVSGSGAESVTRPQPVFKVQVYYNESPVDKSYATVFGRDKYHAAVLSLEIDNRTPYHDVKNTDNYVKKRLTAWHEGNGHVESVVEKPYLVLSDFPEYTNFPGADKLREELTQLEEGKAITAEIKKALQALDKNDPNFDQTFFDGFIKQSGLPADTTKVTEEQMVNFLRVEYKQQNSPYMDYYDNYQERTKEDAQYYDKQYETYATKVKETFKQKIAEQIVEKLKQMKNVPQKNGTFEVVIDFDVEKRDRNQEGKLLPPKIEIGDPKPMQWQKSPPAPPAVQPGAAADKGLESSPEERAAKAAAAKESDSGADTASAVSDSGAPNMDTPKLKIFKKAADELLDYYIKVAKKNSDEDAIKDAMREKMRQYMNTIMPLGIGVTQEEMAAMDAYSAYQERRLKKMGLKPLSELRIM